MLTHLSLQNFQSHANTDLYLHPGVNIIVGETDSGKSALLRAIRFVTRNRAPKDPISWWADHCRVSIATAEGTVFRMKGKNKERYVLEENDKEPLEFVAFGQSIPEEIKSFFNMGDVNVQEQLDSPFLLSRSAGEVASHFNKIAKLEKIEIATDNVNSRIRSLTTEISRVEKKIEEDKGQLVRYDFLEKAEIELEVLEELQLSYAKLNNNKAQIKHILDEHSAISRKIEEYTPLLDCAFLYEEIIESKRQYNVLSTTRNSLDSLVDQIAEINEEILQTGLLLVLEDIVDKALGLFNEKRAQIYTRGQLNLLFSQIVDLQDEISRMSTNFYQWQKEFNDNMPDDCPLCGSPVTHDNHLK